MAAHRRKNRHCVFGEQRILEFNQTVSDKEVPSELTELCSELGEGSAAVSPHNVDYGFQHQDWPMAFALYGATDSCAPITFGCS